VVCVLPGSRAQEVKRMLPLFESALDLLADKVPMLTAIIPTAPSHVITDAVTKAVKAWKTPNILLPYASEKDKYSAFAVSFRTWVDLSKEAHFHLRSLFRVLNISEGPTPYLWQLVLLTLPFRFSVFFLSSLALSNCSDVLFTFISGK